MIKCKRCGRPLTDPKSIRTGMGSTCLKKAMIAKERQRRRGIIE